MNNVTVRLTAVLMGLAAMSATASAQSAPEPLSPRAEAVVQAWRALMDANRAFTKTLPAPEGVAEELAARVAFEQAARDPLIVISRSKLPTEDMRSAIGAIFREVEAIDADNTAYLKSVLPADGWFRRGRDGTRTASNAWVIVQHSPDRAFQKQVLTAMEPLVKAGEVSGGDYALLYDRTEMHADRPQRYGSQASCKNGVMTFHTLEDPARVEEWRRSVGLTETLADYGVTIGVGKPC